jgi:hypothetical protein
VNHGAGDGKPLALSAGEFPSPGPQQWSKVQVRGHALHHRGALSCRDRLSARGMPQGLSHGKTVVEAVEVLQVTDPTVTKAWLFEHVHAIHLHGTRHRPHQGRETGQQGRLASTVGADQGRDASPLDLKRQTVQRAMGGVVEDQVCNCDGAGLVCAQ